MKQDILGAMRPSPVRDGLLAALATLLVAGISLTVIYAVGIRVQKKEVQSSLVRTALTAAALVDGDLHRTLTRPEQESGDDYRRAVEPLHKVLKSLKDIRFLYTMTLHSNQACFVLDATPPGDADHDGVEDHSRLMEPYGSDDPVLLDALKTGRAQADETITTDRWGQYLSGYAPIVDSRGEQVGIAGVDMRVDQYAHRLGYMRKALAMGMYVALVSSGLVGFAVWSLRRATTRARAARAKTALALQESDDRKRKIEHEYRMVFEQMIDGFANHEIICDADGKPVDYRFLAVNPAFERLTGLKASDVVGKTVREALQQVEESWIETYGKVALTGEAIHFEEYSKALDRHFEVTAYRPAPGQFACVFVDVTARRRADAERGKIEEQLRNVQRLEGIGLLAGGIAHDFNNLLMAILGNVDLALDDLPGSSPARSCLSQIKQVSLRAADLCRQMLAYSGRGKFQVVPVNLSQLVEEIAGLLSVSVPKTVLLRYDLARSMPCVEADITQLRQVIMNLVINAAEAIEQRSGVITVRTGATECDEAYLRSTFVSEDARPGLHAFLEVADTGIGMDKDTMNRIFDPFFTTKFAGRGLGLAAVLGIVRGHKGAIKVYSEPGKGSMFKLLFPASAEGDLTLGARAQLPAWHGSGVALLVDDDETVRAVVGRMLERCGFSVETVTNGRDALRSLSENNGRYRCVLMDLTMPHMGGEEAYRELRVFDCKTPVILMSGYSEQEIGQRLVGRGIDGFIQKPFEYRQLLETLQAVLGPEGQEKA